MPEVIKALRSKSDTSGYHAELCILDDVVLTPQEVRAQAQRERRSKEKERQLDRRTKRQAKRSQCY